MTRRARVNAPGDFPARPAHGRRAPAGWIPIFASVLLVLGVPAATMHATPSNLAVQGQLSVLTLHGTHYEAGLAHGSALREAIHPLVDLYKLDIHDRFNVDADEFLAAFMDRSDFLPALRRWAPGLLEEVRGIAAGAGIDFNTMLAYQLVDEVWVMGGSVSAEKCTTVALRRTANQPSTLAQNLDIPRFYHGHQLLLRFRDTESGIEQDVVSFPGYLGASGLNNFSVGVGANALPDLKPTPNGLPVAFVVRSALERKTYGEAVAFMRTIRHAAPQNYMVGDAGEVGSFECSDTTVAEFRPFASAGFTYHTNRPLVNQDYTTVALALLAATGQSRRSYPAGCPRLQFVRRTLGDGTRQADVALLKRLLADRDSGVNNPTTYASLIMVLKASPELQVSAGRPDEEPFQVFHFGVNELGGK